MVLNLAGPDWIFFASGGKGCEFPRFEIREIGHIGSEERE
jgi:hypothetical protein